MKIIFHIVYDIWQSLVQFPFSEFCEIGEVFIFGIFYVITKVLRGILCYSYNLINLLILRNPF